MASMVLKKIRLRMIYFLLFFPVISCGSVNQTITYNESNYELLKQKTRINVRFVDGRIVTFYRLEVVSADETHIYAKCWARKNSQPQEWKFKKTDIVITNEQAGGTQAATYILSLGLMIGVIFLLNKLFYD